MTRSKWMIAGLAAALWLVPAGPAVADEAAEADNGQATTYSGTIKYQPPPRFGAPSTRSPGATRGPQDDTPLMIEVIAPADTGAISGESPVLTWYVSRACDYPVELALNQGFETVYSVILDAPNRGGLYSIDLGAVGVRLEPGVEYDWAVSLKRDINRPSADVTACTQIQRRSVDADVQTRISRAAGAERAVLYAENGYFCDAIATLNQVIAKNPSDPGPRAMLADLLRQVDLEEVAAHDAGG